MNSKVTVYSYSSCSTCKKALNWLDQNKITYELIDIVKRPPKKEIIQKAIEAFGEKKNLFNTRGKSYRELGPEIVKSMTNEQAIVALANDGKLIKRPFLLCSSGHILLGFNEKIWSDYFFD